jgi:outer membrane immunogenic protein
VLRSAKQDLKNMKRIILGVAAALFLSAGQAAADGLPSRSHVKASDDAPVTWRGFYAGLNAGLATGNTDSNLGGLTFDYELNGAVFGGQVGWLGQSGNIVYGIEGTYSGSNIQGSDAGCLVLVLGVNCSRNVEWMATVVGRVGIAYDRVLVYGLAGVAWADVESRANIINPALGSISGSETHVGWTAGFGIEWALSSRVSARIEYAHIDLGEETHRLGGAIPLDVNLEMDTIRLGVNVKLGH